MHAMHGTALSVWGKHKKADGFAERKQAVVYVGISSEEERNKKEKAAILVAADPIEIDTIVLALGSDAAASQPVPRRARSSPMDNKSIAYGVVCKLTHVLV